MCSLGGLGVLVHLGDAKCCNGACICFSCSNGGAGDTVWALGCSLGVPSICTQDTRDGIRQAMLHASLQPHINDIFWLSGMMVLLSGGDTADDDDSGGAVSQ